MFVRVQVHEDRKFVNVDELSTLTFKRFITEGKQKNFCSHV